MESGIEINKRGERGFTPLNVALDFGHSDIAEYLLANGADTGIIDAVAEFDREICDLHIQRLAQQTARLGLDVMFR